MTVGEVLELAKFRLKNIASVKDSKVLLSAINLGVSDLYARFNLRFGSETILIHTDLAIYELRNEDVNMLLAVYDKTGRELRQSDTLYSDDFEYKILNYREFMLRHLFDGYLYAVYKASPIKLVDVNDIVDLPDAMISALTTYMAYLIENVINTTGRYGQVKTEPSFYIQIYEKECQSLINRGYVGSLQNSSLAIQEKGYR